MIPPQYHWPAELRKLKLDATDAYVTETMAAVKLCAACQQAIIPTDQLSLTVDVIENPSSTIMGGVFRKFESYVSHLHCKEPELTYRTDDTLEPAVDFSTSYVVALLRNPGGPGEIPFVVFSPDSSFVANLPHDTIDAFTAALFECGFGLIHNPNMFDIVHKAARIETAQAYFQWPRNGVAQIMQGGDNGLPFIEPEIGTEHPTDVAFRVAAHSMGAVLAIAGSGISINTETGEFDLTSAAARGTLTAGFVQIVR
jgi:hypothetical protein